MPEEIIGIEHIFITASDIAASEEFCDRLFEVVGVAGAGNPELLEFAKKQFALFSDEV